jgi:uncharacterized protein YjbI with pentapeptide repeats
MHDSIDDLLGIFIHEDPSGTPSDEEVEALRNRWLGKENILEVVIQTLKMPDVIDEKEIEKQINVANEILSNNGFRPLEDKVVILLDFIDGKSICVPGLDLRGITILQKECIGIIMVGAHLEGSKWVGCHLNSAILTEAKLQKSLFDHCELEGARFERAILYGVDLSSSKLEQSHFEYANLIYAILTDADLTGAHLEHTRLGGAHLENSNFTDAHLEHSNLKFAHLESGERGSLYRAHLEYAELPQCHLEGSFLCMTNLDHANLFHAYLQGANLTGASLKGANLSNVSVGALTLDHFSEDCKLSPEDKENMTKLPIKTIFKDTKYLPLWREHVFEKIDLKRIWKRKKTLSILSNIRENVKFKRINWKDLGRHMFSRWFYTDFLLVNIDDADTIMAKDLYRYVNDQQFLYLFKINHPWIYRIWKLFSDCGGKISIVAFWGIIFVLIFAVLYMILPCPAPEFMKSILPNWMFVAEKPVNPTVFNEVGNSLGGFWKWLFVSFDIFSNLGIRSTHPQNPLGVILILLESVFGFMMLGMLISVLSNRFARRS